MGTVFTEKKDNSTKIKKSLGLLIKYKPLGLIKINNTDLVNELTECLSILPAGFVIYSEGTKSKNISKNIVMTSEIDENTLSGFDFIVCDDDIKELNKYMTKGIVPIVNVNNHLKNILQEFNPVKNEGNSFFYDKESKCNIFYSITRYIENYKFPFDNKNLVKNTINT